MLSGFDVISFTPSLVLMVTFSPKRRKFDVAPKPDSLGSLPLVSKNLFGSSNVLGLTFTALLLGLNGAIFREYVGGSV